MSLDFLTLRNYRHNNPTWKLLCATSSPLIISFFNFAFIELFVSSIAIVKNSDGAYSSLINLSIEEHLAMKENLGGRLWLASISSSKMVESMWDLLLGNLDTHGFAILDRLRRHFPHTISFLMDEETLLNHPYFWSKESKQESKSKMENLTLLTEDELQIYLSLQYHQFVQNMRLEQEFIPFQW